MSTSEGFYDKDLDAGLTELEIGGDKVGVSYKFEKEIDELINCLAKKGKDYTRKVDGIDKEFECQHQFDEYPEDLPNNKGGVLLYYFLKGIEQDFKVKFKNKPRCVEIKNTSGRGSSENTLTAKDKNEILEQCNMLYYDEMGLDDEEIFAKMQAAMQKKKFWESKGWFLTPEKTKPAYKVDSDKYKEYLQKKEDTARDRQQRGKTLGNTPKK